MSDRHDQESSVRIPAIFSSEESGRFSAVFAVEVSSIPEERLGSGSRSSGESAILEERLRDHVDLLRVLAGAGDRTTFALRYVAKPGRRQGEVGGLRAWLLVRVFGSEKNALVAQATKAAAQFVGTLYTLFPEHGFKPVTTPKEFLDAWRPFGSARPAFLSSLRRSLRDVRLGTPPGRAGLAGVAVDRVEEPEKGFAVAAIEARPSTLARICRALELRAGDSIFQITFRSAQLGEEAEECLTSEIARLQEVDEAAEGWERDREPMARGLSREEIRLLKRTLEERLERLRKEACVFDVSLASTEPLESELVHLVASELTGEREERRIGQTQQIWTAQLVASVETEDGGAPGRAWRALALDLGTDPDWAKRGVKPFLVRLGDSADVVAAGFRFPTSFGTTETALPVQVSRHRTSPRPRSSLRAAPEEMPIGVNRTLGRSTEVFLTDADRRQHVYCVGQTGVGKSTLLRSLILGDIAAGRGVAVIDPHGDLFEDLLERIPKHRWDDVVLLDPTDSDFPVGLNPLECSDGDTRHRIAREMRAIMARLLEDQYPGYVGNVAGPMFFLHLEMNLLLTMSRPDDPGTLVEFYEIFQRKDYWKKWLPLAIDDSILRRWVEVTLKKVDYLTRGSEHLTLGEYVSSKFEDFVFDPRLRLIFGQKRSTIRIPEILDERKIFLVNLSIGRLSEANSRFLGMVLMALVQTAIYARASRSAAERTPFHLYVDEFQSISTDSFSVLLSEARKYGLGIVLANQFISQIKNEKIMQAVFGNVATLVTFRVGEADATKHLEPLFRPHFDVRDLTNLPNWQAYVRTTSGGAVVPPFRIETLQDSMPPIVGAAEEIRKLSRAKYGRSKEKVSREVELSVRKSEE